MKKSYYHDSNETRNFGFNYCGDSNQLEDKDDCGSIINSSKMREKFQKCIGEKKCTFTLNDPEFVDSSNAKAECKTDKVQLYLQYSCKMTEDQVRESKVIGCIAALITFLACLIFYETISVEKKMHDLKEMQNDMLESSPADYTV